MRNYTIKEKLLIIFSLFNGKEKLFIATIIIVVIVGGVWAFNTSHNSTANTLSNNTLIPIIPETIEKSDLVIIPPDSPKLEQIHIQEVQTLELPKDELTAPGKIEINPNRVSRVVLPVTGQIVSVQAKIGDRVEQGQTLIEIQSPEANSAMSAYLQAENGIKQAQVEIVKAQTDVAKSQADLERLKDLYEHNAVAQKEVLNTQNTLTLANATLDSTKSALQQAHTIRQEAAHRLELLGLSGEHFGERIKVHAPTSGKILEMSIAPGEYRSDTTTSFMTITDLSRVRVTSDVPESLIRFIAVGDKLEITLTAYPNEVFTARVARILDTIDPQSRTVKVQADLDNPNERFKPDMFGTIKLKKATEVAVVLPTGAVIQGNGRSTVFMEESKGKFKEVEVKTGKQKDDLLEILSGVKAGDRVVVEGAMLLKAQ